MQMLSKELIRTAADLYYLKSAAIADMEKMGEMPEDEDKRKEVEMGMQYKLGLIDQNNLWFL